MMTLTDYYKMTERDSKSKMRLECVASTGGYEPFEKIARKARCGRFFGFLGEVPKTFSMDARRKADLIFSNAKNISSIFIPNVEKSPHKGYGDTKDTNDALFFQFTEDFRGVEIFVARNVKPFVVPLFPLFVNGKFDKEIEELRMKAKPV